MATGTLIAEGILSGTLNGESELKGVLSTTIISESPEYTGSYNIIPSASENITLPTADRHVSHDISVGKIPRYEVGNLGGGYTFIIAEG